MQLFISMVALVVAAVVLFVHWQRFKLDLFKERAEVFGRMRQILRDVTVNGRIELEQVIEFGAAHFQTKYLFGRDIHGQVVEFRGAIEAMRNAADDLEKSIMAPEAYDRAKLATCEANARKVVTNLTRFDDIFEDSLMISENPFVWFTNRFRKQKSG